MSEEEIELYVERIFNNYMESEAEKIGQEIEKIINFSYK